MGKKEQNEKERVEAVLQLLRKQAPLSVKQEKFCNYECIERFLKSKGENIKKTVKQLRCCLSWRESIGIENLIADEFSGELAEGSAYVAGHDEESRPVIIFRLKEDCRRSNSRKFSVRLFAFTLEVAIATMLRNVVQFIIIFDASFSKSASSLLGTTMGALKILSEYYPGRLHRAFVVDPLPVFSYLWTGARRFVELSPITTVVVTTSATFSNANITRNPRASSLRFDPSNKISSSSSSTSASSRFIFSVSHLDSLKPWHLTTSSHSVLSPLDARCHSFHSPLPSTTTSTTHGGIQRNYPSTPSTFPGKYPRTPSFFPSPSMFFKKEKNVDMFLPYVEMYRRPYNEMGYRLMMKPPLAGLISIVSPHRRRYRPAAGTTTYTKEIRRY